MRIIAGSSGGRRLFVPKTGVRPTMDRVKAALFSSLGERVVGARVLDLFAGTGALGIEALSRGAETVTFVENDRRAVEAIERNLIQAGFTGHIRQQDVFDFLRHTRAGTYDLVFADPPYEKTGTSHPFTKLLLQEAGLASSLTSKGLFVLEKRPGESLPASTLWQVIRRKTYGATETLFLQRSTTE